MKADLENFFESKKGELEEWLARQGKGLPPPLYLSCDIRHSAAKIAVIDSNLFPAGFNNLCPSYSREAAGAFGNYFREYHPACRRILIYGEEHTRNKFYLKNLTHLQRLMKEAGYEVRAGMIGADWPQKSITVRLEEGDLRLDQIERSGNILSAGDFIPDLVVLNNDLSTGIPEALKKIPLPVIPRPELGWHRRKKQDHFLHLRKLLDDLGNNFGIDPWFLCPLTDHAPAPDLADESSLKLLAEKTDNLLGEISQKYEKHDIRETPYVYIKNNRGTYGMGMIPVFSGKEIFELNRRQRTKLASAKGGQKAEEYLLQEGIRTADFYSGYPIEPVIYLVGGKPVGGFFRIHEEKNEFESLNAPGMSFSCLCLHKLSEPHEEYFLDCAQKEKVVAAARFLARVAALAAAQEEAELG